jgi:pyrroline-5-carboxylate reductase
MMRLVLVGGGRMGEALLAGLIDGGWAEPTDLAVVEISEARRAALAEQYGVQVSPDPVAAEGAVLAVKPADAPAACRAAVEAGATRVLSIAAGVTIDALEEAAGEGVAVVRAMPNTPALVGQGAAAIAGGAAAGGDDLDWAASILSAVGTVHRVPEHQLDAVTGLSGSGPAYVFLVAEALVGLPRDVAVALATQTLLGSATLLAQSDDDASALRAAVTSPGGTTAAGLRALEAAGVRSAIIDAVVAATDRSRQLGA